MPNQKIIQRYKDLKSAKNQSGDYKKILFHTHTPASYDYRFKSNWTYKNYEELSEKTLFDEYITSSFSEKISEILSTVQLEKNLNNFQTKKEFYSYLLIANQLFKNNYELVVVTDHNTTKGLEKLQIALDELYLPVYNHCNVIYGIEITCADRLHVVGMFQINQLDKVNKWIDENLISEEYGVMKSSYDVLKYFYSIGCFAYIAHINTSELLNGKKIFSGGYKNELLGGCYSKFIGVNSVDAIQKYTGYLNKISSMNRNFILDCDAHSHEEIPTESMWIKVANNSTASFFEALKEYEITVRISKPKTPSIFIEGINIGYSEDGYLIGKNKTDYLVRYSPSLNSYIGGRGTGKSTTLDLMNFVLTQEFKDKDQLYFFSLHGEISVLVNYYDDEFIIIMKLPEAETAIDLIAVLSNLDPLRYRTSINYNKFEVKKYILMNYVKVYKIIKNKSPELSAEKQHGNKTFLNKIYDEKHSINSLVEKANNNEFGNYIYDLFFNDSPLESMSKKVRFRSRNGLYKFLNSIESILQERKNKVDSIINPYNLSEKDKMKIIYTQNEINDYELPNIFKIPKSQICSEYDITPKEINEYIQFLIRTYSFTGFIKLCISKSDFKESPSISLFARHNREPNYDKTTLTKLNGADTTSVLLHEFIEKNTIETFIKYYKSKLDTVDEFTIEFNVNAYESSTHLKNIFKDIKELSLGQKVVTILNLILSHGNYYENLKPVIIDQPEDNLDSRYIYKNLVEQLRQLKEKRQIIIATHNSTIVTNSLSENVIIMESDGEHGWISKYGYSLKHSIKKEILNILEGGENSFKHRQNVFNDLIN